MQPDIDKMDIHQLRERVGELRAELAAVLARMEELGAIEDEDAEPSAEPGQNAHPEGEDVP